MGPISQPGITVVTARESGIYSVQKSANKPSWDTALKAATTEKTASASKSAASQKDKTGTALGLSQRAVMVARALGSNGYVASPEPEDTSDFTPASDQNPPADSVDLPEDLHRRFYGRF